MHYTELLGLEFLLGPNAECVFTRAELIDIRFLLVEITIPLLNNWKISELTDLLVDAMDPEDLTDNDIDLIKERLTITYNTDNTQ